MQYICAKSKEMSQFIICKWTLFETLVLAAGIYSNQLLPYKGFPNKGDMF